MNLEQDQLIKQEVLAIFEEVLHEMCIKNYSKKVSCGTEKGQNYLGIIAQVQVNGCDNKMNNVQLHFIIKSAPHDEEYRKLAFVENCYNREIYIYSKLLPEFERIQYEKGIINCFRCYPLFYKASSKCFMEALILQDLKFSGYRHYNQQKFIDCSHIYLLVQKLGAFHALSYATRILKPYLFEDIVKNTQEASFNNFGTECIRSVSKHRIELALKSLDSNSIVYKKFKNFSENMFEILSKCIDSKLVDEYAVINHGDCALTNYMFKYQDSENPNRPTDVCFLDWQLARLGSPVLDLTIILFSTTNQEIRDKHYHSLIMEYYNSVCSMLKEFGIDPKQTLPYQVLLHHLKKYSIFGLYWAILLIYIQLQNVEEKPNSANDVNPFCYNLKNLQEFHTRVKDLILDFDSLKYNFEW
ncbi:hypothetical protein RN001_000494 [Aquatica leii]|uniref:CHK kinase-like domain-containing protein n=1 Tax=Aquatica leii TaxID=1421715 RepID=A0AAN7QM23_9COLE|nr:hypothetical protein RN001_000494 [Aquatica leii]